MAKQVTLKITGLHCGGCAANAEKALKSVAGVTTAKVDLAGGKASVEFDPVKTDEKALAQAVKKAGYGVG